MVGLLFMKLKLVTPNWLGWKSKIEFPLGITPRYVKKIKFK